LQPGGSGALKEDYECEATIGSTLPEDLAQQTSVIGELYLARQGCCNILNSAQHYFRTLNLRNDPLQSLFDSFRHIKAQPRNSGLYTRISNGTGIIAFAPAVQTLE
jgi:hypothetical protein